jgi:hypothetical protein
MKKGFFAAAMLAIALIGFAATKASTNLNRYYVFDSTISEPADRCYEVVENTNCNTEDATPCTYASTGLPIYESKSGNNCVDQLKFDAK